MGFAIVLDRWSADFQKKGLAGSGSSARLEQRIVVGHGRA